MSNASGWDFNFWPSKPPRWATEMAADLKSIKTTLENIQAILTQENKELTEMNVDLTALQAAVKNATTVEESGVTLIKGIAAQLAALASQPTVNPADLQAMVTELNTGAGDLAAAITANTPAAPPAPPAA